MNQAKYSIIVKCSLAERDFKKWRTVTDLAKFTAFITREFPEWKFFNVYDKQTKGHLQYFSRSNPPHQKTLNY